MQIVFSLLLPPLSVHFRVPHDHVLVKTHGEVQGDVHAFILSRGQVNLQTRGTVNRPAANHQDVASLQSAVQVSREMGQHFIKFKTDKRTVQCYHQTTTDFDNDFCGLIGADYKKLFGQMIIPA